MNFLLSLLQKKKELKKIIKMQILFFLAKRKCKKHSRLFLFLTFFCVDCEKKKMDEKGMYQHLLTGSFIFFPIFIIIWLTTIFATLIGCSKKKPGPVKKVGDSAASNVSPLQPGNIKASTAGKPGGNAAGAGAAVGATGNGANGKPTPSSANANNNKKTAESADNKNAGENKDVSYFEKKFIKQK